MFNLFVLSIMTSCVENSVQKVSHNPGNMDPIEENICDCVDYSADIARLETEIQNLRSENEQISTELEGYVESMYDVTDRVADLENAPSEPASSIVVSEYEVSCTSGRDSNGAIVYNSPYSFTNYLGDSVVGGGCLIANIDPNDPPYNILVGNMLDYSTYYPKYSRANSISLYGSDRPDLYIPYMNFGNNLQYSPYFLDALGAGNGTIIDSDGLVYLLSTGTITQPDYSSGSEVWKDVPVRVVIMDDKSYSAP